MGAGVSGNDSLGSSAGRGGDSGRNGRRAGRGAAPRRRHRDRAVGTRQACPPGRWIRRARRLDDEPLPDEPFQWKGIPDDVVDRVQEVLDLTDRCCDQLLDVECRTACRRLLGRIAAAGSDVFRRKGRPETAAAAVVWVIGKVNDVFDLYGGGLQVNELMSHFRLTGSASQRAGTMLRTAGFDSGTVRSQSRVTRLSGCIPSPGHHLSSGSLPRDG